MFLKVSRKTFSILFFSLLIFAIAGSALAVDYEPLVNIPGVDGSTLTGYLSGLYNFLISIVGILAMAVIVYGGMRYVVSAGNPAAMEDAKEAIWSAIYGLALALGSWLIINIVNPDILVLKNPGVGGPGGAYSYSKTENSCVESPLGNGTKDNPCQCIDGAKVTANTGISLTATTLVLTILPNPASTVPPGNSVTFSGKLTDEITGAGLAGKAVKINRINTTLNASSTFNVVTDPLGNFSFNFMATCATGVNPDQVQAVFAGDATYASSSSSSAAFTVGGAIVCVFPGDYLTSPAVATSSSGSFCNRVCSDKTLAVQKMNPDGSWIADGTYHCLKAGVRIGWVGDPTNYTDEQLRALAVSTGTNASPFTAYDGSYYIFEVEKYTTSLYPIAEYTFDKDYVNGNCEAPLFPSINTGYHKATAGYGIVPPPPPASTCTNSAAPLALICSQKFCVKDSQGNTAFDTIYYSILKK